MNTFLLASLLAAGAVPAAAARLAPRTVTPVPPARALMLGVYASGSARPSLSPSLQLPSAPLHPALSAPSLGASLPELGAAPGAPAEAAAEGALGALQGGAAKIAESRGDEAAASARFFDALSAPNDGPAFFSPAYGGSARSPYSHELARIGAAAQRLEPSPVGADVYNSVRRDFGDRLRIFVDDNPSADWDARLEWRDGNPVLILTASMLREARAPALAAFLVRELSQAYYRGFTDSAERSWLAHAAMVQTYAEITGSSVRWDHDNDYYRDGRPVMKTMYDHWSGALRNRRDPRETSFFGWLASNSDSRSGPNAHLSLSQQRSRGLIGRETFNQMDAYFRDRVEAQYRWLDARPY